MKKNHYIDKDEFFGELSQWQDFKIREDMGNILYNNIVELNNSKKEIIIISRELDDIENPSESKVEEINHRKMIIKQRLDELNESLLEIEQKYEKIKLNPRERSIYKRLYDNIGIKIMKIINHFATKPCYSNYPFLEDMKMLAMEHCIKGLLKFDRSNTKKNPFWFFSKSVWHAFLQEIAKEKRLLSDKQNYVKNFITDEMIKYDYNMKRNDEISDEEFERILNEEDGDISDEDEDNFKFI